MASRWSLPEDDQPAPAAPLAPLAAPPALLKQAALFVAGLKEAVTDAEIVASLWECLKVRPRIERPGDPSAQARGHIEFESLDRAEKAYATVNGQTFPESSSTLGLHFSSTLTDDPEPAAAPLMFKCLPLDTTPGALFDLCRPFGPVFRVALQLSEGPRRGSSAAPVFKGQAIVTFYEEDHAKRATDELHCSELGGNSIIVQQFIPSRARKSDVSSWTPSASSSPSRWATAEPPAGADYSSLSAGVPPFTPTARRTVSSSSPKSIHAGGSPSSPRIGHGSASSQSALAVDPANLFIKNLDPRISSNDLFFLFKRFGRIVSARVMTDDSQRSKEFGFVSYETPESAVAALQAMDGQPAGPSGRAIVVRLHEPKRYREERMRDANGSEGMSDVELGMKSLSTGPSPGDSPVTAPQSRRTSSSFNGSPSLDYSSAATSPSSSPLVTAQSEHDRLVSAVQSIEPTQFGEVVQLLEGLPKKERAMCLFNPEYLRLKVADALLVLNSSDDDESPSQPAVATASPIIAPNTEESHVVSSISELAALPAATIVTLKSQLAALGVPEPDEDKTSETDLFMDSLEGKPPHEMKQKLGERLFKAIKATGIKGAPRITIALLDSEELRPLAHLILLPEVLKQKVLLVAVNPAK